MIPFPAKSLTMRGAFKPVNRNRPGEHNYRLFYTPPLHQKPLPIMPDIWSKIDKPAHASQYLYIAVSGNTGSGKSTLISKTVLALSSSSIPALGIDERLLSHPFFPLMLTEPKRYSFPVQIHFAVQRSLALLRALQNRHTVVLERSHLEDRLFVQDHFARGNISSTDYETYTKMFRSLHTSLPEPDVIVLLNVSSEISFRRITAAETAGERPIEFPNDNIKASYVGTWYQRYEEFFKWLLSEKHQGRLARTFFLSFVDHFDPEDAAQQIAVLADQLVKAKRSDSGE